MKRTKSELLIDLENMTEEKDILFDKLEMANSEIDDLEDEITDLREKEDTLNLLIDYIDQYHVAQARYTMGILSELETIEKLTEKLLDMRSSSW
jgi:predicted nuclease with TOPRIM domain